MIDHIHWLGHASFRINGPPHDDGPVIYIDPWLIPKDSRPADIILVSHDHYDHCSLDDIDQIRTQDTAILANQRAAERIGCGAQVLRAWQGAVNIGGVCIRAVPAYTMVHAHHDIAYGGLGFLLSIMRHDIYYAGDTDLIPEMNKIGCDIALLPVGGVYTMDCDSAVEASRILAPSIAVPMHYGREVPGSKDEGRRFCQLANSGVEAIELPIENERFRVARSD